MTYRITFAAFFLVMSIVFQSAASPVINDQPKAVLFGDLNFGLTKARALTLPGAARGKGELSGEVVLPELEFAGLPWMARLEFRKMPIKDAKAANQENTFQETLVRVCLVENYDRTRLEKVNTQLREDGFEMLAMSAEGKKLDFLSILKAFGPEELQKRIADLYKRDDLKFMSFAWFDTRNISREMKAFTRNLNELLHIVSADTREAEVTLTGANGKIANLLVIFSLPIMEIQTFGSDG